MIRLDAAPEIRNLAEELGVGAAAPVEAILAYCRRRIDGWVAEAESITSINALESLVTQRLQMVFEEIRGDDDFDRLTEVYARGKKEFVFAGMRAKFDDANNQTYGALIQRRNAGASDPDRFVAVIDYTTIVQMAKRVPESVIQEDQALLMYFDNASLLKGE